MQRPISGKKQIKGKEKLYKICMLNLDLIYYLIQIKLNELFNQLSTLNLKSSTS